MTEQNNDPTTPQPSDPAPGSPVPPPPTYGQPSSAPPAPSGVPAYGEPTPPAPGYGAPGDAAAGYGASAYPAAAPYGTPTDPAAGSAPAYGSSAPGTPAYGAPAYGTPGYGAGYPAPAPKKTNGKAVAALILGILALLGSWIPFANIVSILMGIAALILGILGVKAARSGVGGRGLGIGGVVTGGVAIVVSALVLGLSIAALNSIDDDDLQQIIDDAMTPPVETPAADQETAVAPEDESVDEPAAGEEGTRDLPFPAGTPIGNDVVTVTLGAATWDATADIAAANEFNDPAPEGSTYVLLPVTVTNDASTEAITPWADLTVSFVADDGRSFDQEYVVAPNDLMDVSDLYEGGTGTGNLVFAIPTEVQGGGTWAVSFQWSDPVFVSAH